LRLGVGVAGGGEAASPGAVEGRDRGALRPRLPPDRDERAQRRHRGDDRNPVSHQRAILLPYMASINAAAHGLK